MLTYLTAIKWMKKLWQTFAALLAPRTKSCMGTLTRIWIPLPQPATGKHSHTFPLMTAMRRAGREVPMVYSHTQISQYLRCPRSYRYRYLDGWREKETRAAMAFGLLFENALGAYFRE